MKKPTWTTALLYWLFTLCGLAGITVLRADAPDDVLALWLGSVVGLAGGQLVARWRLRAWVFAAVGVVAVWLMPVFVFVLYEPWRPAIEMFGLALVPAVAGGYLSLSERWGLASFWYPAMLWMLVVLDGPGGFDAYASLPLLAGVAGFFVAFMRARETRRVALWQAHSVRRLAERSTRSVLRDSPVRAFGEHAWTVGVGTGALLLAAIIGPSLWQREQVKERAARAERAVALSNALALQAAGTQPCCKATVDAPVVRVREYFAPRTTRTDEDRIAEQNAALSCRVCEDRAAGVAALGDSDPTSDGPPVLPAPGAGGPTLHGAVGDQDLGPAGKGVPLSTYPVVPEVSPPEPLPAPHHPAAHPAAAAPVVKAAPHGPKTSVPATTAHAVTTATPSAAGAPALTAFAPYVTAAPEPRAMAGDGAPWRGIGLAALAALAAVLGVRSARRALRLRHLARPFWNEPVDQRISNHWERMLVALRDAGIHPRDGEQPQALARRVGIPAAGTCATILERARHGVRIEPDDLDTMDRATSDVVRAVHARAGVLARAVAFVR
ncbi:MAG: hypothetical protein JWP97_5131 [Labilithrix sp.]|nr:hypothetical protein [Labilithrix sp.]